MPVKELCFSSIPHNKATEKQKITCEELGDKLFSPTWPSGPSWCSSRKVCLCVVCVFIPFPCDFFKASVWPCDPMISLRQFDHMINLGAPPPDPEGRVGENNLSTSSSQVMVCFSVAIS